MTTAFVSMFISNAATTAMMLPIVEAFAIVMDIPDRTESINFWLFRFLVAQSVKFNEDPCPLRSHVGDKRYVIPELYHIGDIHYESIGESRRRERANAG